MRFNNPLQLAWQIHALDAIMLISTIFILAYSVRHYRGGRPTYLVLYLGSLAYGLIMELTTGMLISRSYIQGEFTVMIRTKDLLGYPTDMPLYVMVGFYPVIIFVAFKVMESFGIKSILARSVSAGVVMLLIDAPYEVSGTLSNVKWWTWLDWQIGGRHIFEYWYGWPMGEAMWQLTWPGFMMWMIWHWEQRNAATADAITHAKSVPWKTLGATPIVLGILMNTCGVLMSSPIGIAIGFNLPHYPVVLVMAIAFAAVFLFSAKTPVALDRAGWALVVIQVVGYGAVTLSDFARHPVPGGQITLALIASATFVILAAYPAYAQRQRISQLASPLVETSLASPSAVLASS